MYKLYLQNGKTHNDFLFLQNANYQLSELINKNKKKYHERLTSKLNNPSTSAKAFWSILKTFVNGKKIPSIPPIFENGKFISNFSSKAMIFNTFFSQQCTNVVTSSTLPSTPYYVSNKRLSQLNFDIAHISNIICKLNPNKAHGHDGISIRMIQLSRESIVKPLFILFRNCFEASVFPNEWKKGNIIPVYKKGEKQIVGN